MLKDASRVGWRNIAKTGMDGATAAADVAYRMSEMSFLFPITPSSPLGESVERWASQGKKNVYGKTLDITQMQSEGGAAGAIHGAAGLGVLTTTFTASQGLLLMLPDIYRMAGDQYPGVFHVAARSIGTYGISIYGDQSDIQIAKMTGIAMLASSSPQECADIGAIAHAASISASYPFIHFFDGFRTSHEINSIVPVQDDTLKQMIDQEALSKYKQSCLTPERPQARGLIYPIELAWQFGERANKDIAMIEPKVKWAMKNFERLTGRKYSTFEYFGSPNATDVIVAMGSGAKTVEEYIRYTGANKDIGVVNIHLFRPFNAREFIKTLPAKTKRITVLDKTRDPLAASEPLHTEICAAAKIYRPDIYIVGGKYGISSKNFNPTHVKAVFKNMQSETPMKRFCVGINEDITNTSLPLGEIFETVPKGTKQCIFWGFGSDGTIGACKDAIKIIVDNTELYGQGHFEYSAHKSGGITVSYLRFGPEPIVSPYLIQQADYIACHKPSFIQRIDVVEELKAGGTLVFNKQDSKSIDEFLPSSMRKKIAEKNAKIYAIDASALAQKYGLYGRINTIMQSVFFLLSDVLPKEKALELMKNAAKKTYANKGEKVVEKNIKLIDEAAEHLKSIEYDREKWLNLPPSPSPTKDIPAPYHDVLGAMITQTGNRVPVSKVFQRGENPSGATQYEKRGIGEHIPTWDEKKCIQCGLCSTICPHSVIRPFLLQDSELTNGKVTIENAPNKTGGAKYQSYKFTIQVSAYDCTGCSKCAQICPADALHMKKAEPLLDSTQAKFNYVRSLPVRGDDLSPISTKNTQFRQPLVEFSGACAGCGETAIVKMISQLYGDHSYMTFATGCPVVWGASAPSVAFTSKPNGKGPAWSSSLYEDHAEFGYGQHKALEYRRRSAKEAMQKIYEDNKNSKEIKLVEEILGNWEKPSDMKNIDKLMGAIDVGSIEASPDMVLELKRNRDFLTHKMNWIFGGDGWAYDIGFGGLDHILASGEPVKVVVMDTEVYSNTGGQSSKASQRSSATSFSQRGVGRKKKDLALIAQTYGNIYVANTCLDADPKQALKAVTDAATYDGPSLIINYSPCIEHGYNKGLGAAPKHCRDLVQAGYLLLSRFDPRLQNSEKGPLQLDSKRPDFKVDEIINQEVRFANLQKRLPERAADLRKKLHEDLVNRYDSYARLVASYQKPK